jgi:hypothetical protein
MPASRWHQMFEIEKIQPPFFSSMQTTGLLPGKRSIVCDPNDLTLFFPMARKARGMDYARFIVTMRD